MTALGILWFILIFVLIIGYFVLDGMDLGIGVLYPFLGKSEEAKRFMLRAVGPIWDGNEVWLLTAGGALFAAFAPAYATSFSGFYLAIMLVLFGLILRAVAVEFCYHNHGSRKLWDALFFVGSLLPALLFGVAVGNLLVGLPLNANGDYTGTFLQLLGIFPLLCGVLGLVHMLVQGAAWMARKAPAGGTLRLQAAKLRRIFALVEIIVFVIVSALFFLTVVPNSSVGYGVTALGIVFAVVYVVSLIGTLWCGTSEEKRDLFGVIFAGLGCVGLVGIWAATAFPYLVPAVKPIFSITIANAASSDTALAAMTVIACIGVPIVLIYHILVYRAFRGRLSKDDIK